MNLPVLLIAEEPACHRTIAGLSVLDRLVVAAHRAGAEKITVVCAGERPDLARAHALGIAVDWRVTPPELDEKTLVAAGQLVADENDLQRVMAGGGRLVSDARELLPCGVTDQWAGSLEDSLPDRPRIPAQGVARVVKDGLTAAQAEDALWDTMGSATDGLVDTHFNRPLGRPLSRLLIHTRITPNQVSVFAIAVGMGAAFCFTLGLAQWMVLGAVLLQFSAVIGCVDGDLARMGFRETMAGKWIARGGDQLVRLCLLAGMASGMHRLDEGAGPALWLGLSAAVGTVIFFVMILRADEPLQRFINKTVNRDYSVLLLALTLAHRVEWFLWMAAVGIHVHWLAAWWVCRRDEPEVAA